LSALPVRFHELVVAPAALVVAAVHARRALGGRRAAVELVVLAAYGYALEAAAIRVFSSHTYGAAWALAPLGVPLAVAMVWAAIIASAMALAARTGARSAPARAGIAALIAVSLDLLMEPVAVRLGLWRWTPAGPWLGVPVGNFVGWTVIVAGYAFGAERFAGDGTAWSEAPRRMAVATVSVVALVLVGLTWRGLRAESAFQGSRGWIAWASVLAATAAAVRRPPTGDGRLAGPGLGARLGRSRGHGPQVVFLGLAAVFAADAAVLGDPSLWLVALGATAVLLWVSGTASSGS
jgi:uncharacterized membrane protein